jgi:hypothetical protein
MITTKPLAAPRGRTGHADRRGPSDGGPTALAPRVAAVALGAAFVVAACGGKRGSTSGPDASRGQSSRCDLAAIGLAGARPIPFWKAPELCQAGSPTSARIRSDDDFRAHFACPDGVSPGIEFSRHELVVEARDLSPAGGVGEMVEDDATITRVAYFRPPCPGDPLPMPVTLEVAYLVPAGDARPIAEASCSVGGCP